MSIRSTLWPAGTPCWCDLQAPDVAGAGAFYAAVLGWSLSRLGPEYGDYRLAMNGEHAAAGIGPLPEGAAVATWTMYFATDDVTATAAAITEHGGTLLVNPGAVGRLGRALIAQDPTGAAFGAWQGQELIGAAVTDEPGALVWTDLRSSQPQAARTFFSQVFPLQTRPMGSDEYHVFHRPDDSRPLGGIGPMTGAGASHWLICFGVPDTDAAVATTERAGGQVLTAAADSPFGRMALLTDPFGAAFWVVQRAS